jgi:hypothetical protein
LISLKSVLVAKVAEEAVVASVEEIVLDATAVVAVATAVVAVVAKVVINGGRRPMCGAR